MGDHLDPTATLSKLGGASGDVFGTSVAISADGTTAVIGAPGVNSSTGAAYVFHVSGDGSWVTSSTPTATLTNSAGASLMFWARRWQSRPTAPQRSSEPPA